MTQEEADRTIAGIRRMTAEALKSKEASRQILIDAGIDMSIFKKIRKKRKPSAKKK